MEDKLKPVTVFIIEILKQGWERSRQFPNYYTEGEADGILRRNPSLTISGDFLDYRKREIEYDEPAPVKPCTLPPFGWRCTRGFHEDGPCAAVPTVNPSWLGKTISYVPPVTAKSKTTWIKPPLPAGVEDTPEVRQKLDALTRVPRIGTVATPSDVRLDVGLKTWKMLDCPKCLQRITVDVTDVVTRVTGN